MAVNLSKESRKLPEYTPVHLIDEEETIKPRTVLTVNSVSNAAVLGKLPERTPVHIAEEATSIKTEKQKNKFTGFFSSIINSKFSMRTAIYYIIFIVIAFFMANFCSEGIASIVASFYAGIMKEDNSDLTGMIESLTTLVSIAGNVIVICLLINLTIQLIAHIFPHTNKP